MLMTALAMAGMRASADEALAGYSDTLLDRCWLWGHETGQVDGEGNQWKLDSATSYYHMADAARHMGLVNLNVVRWDCPDKTFRDSLKGMKRVTWPASAHPVEKHPPYPVMWDWDFKVAEEMPNMAGIELDDFFMAAKTNVVWAVTPQGRVKVCPTVFSYEELAAMRRRRDACVRPLEMRLVFYDGLLAQRKEPKDLVPFIDLVTVVTYWTWKAKDIPKLRENFAKYRMLAPTKPTFLGIYLYDFGDMKPMPMDMMKLQMEIGLDLWRKGEIEGFVFLCSSICNRDFPAVRYAREWIKLHGGERREGKVDVLNAERRKLRPYGETEVVSIDVLSGDRPCAAVDPLRPTSGRR